MTDSKNSFEPKVGQLVEVVDTKSAFSGSRGKITGIDEEAGSIEVEIDGHSGVPFWPEELRPTET